MPPQRHLLLINFYTIDLKRDQENLPIPRNLSLYFASSFCSSLNTLELPLNSKPTVHYRVIGLSSSHRLQCQNKVEETGSEPNTLNQLLEELDVLCIASADACEIKDQISMTKRLYLETEAL
ncbi:hypothetical protein T09_14107 [Trichinella sp. T9]|nr:hypothetical protein T09_14107 [Trichinella sp. T9]